MNNAIYLNQCRRSLLAKQRELLAANGGRLVLAPAGVPGADYMDQALAESEAGIDAHLSQARSRMRQSVEWALLRIQKGNYGLCATCGSRISRARLRAVPWADLCRDCSEQENSQF